MHKVKLPLNFFVYQETKSSFSFWIVYYLHYLFFNLNKTLKIALEKEQLQATDVNSISVLSKMLFCLHFIVPK